MEDKKILVVFYSRTGTTKKVAEYLEKTLQCDVEELVDNNQKSGIIGFINGGKDALFKNSTSISEVKQNPNKYDLIVIGSPVWASHITPAVRTYMEENKEKFKEVAYFCTQDSDTSKKSKIFNDMEEICDKKPVVELKLSSKDLNNDEFIKKLEIFKAEILNPNI